MPLGFATTWRQRRQERSLTFGLRVWIIRRTSQRLAQQQQTLKRKSSRKFTEKLSVLKRLAKTDNLNPMNTVLLRQCISVEDVEEECAWKIQLVMIWRERLTAKERIKKIRENQAYQANLIERLWLKLANEDPWQELILGSDYPEVAATVSEFGVKHVTTKSRLVIDALQILFLTTDTKNNDLERHLSSVVNQQLCNG